MLGVAAFFPFAKGVLTCGLNTCLARVNRFFIISISFFTALGADFVFFMRMFGFYFGFIRMCAFGIIRGAGFTVRPRISALIGATCVVG